MDKKISFCVLIPAYNEQNHIGQLLDDVKKYADDILVVDDGSSDDTLAVVKKAGVEYIEHKVNKGKGASLSDGYRYVIDKNYDYVLVMDGDAQHAPDDIAGFIKTAEETSVDIILGNRMESTKDMPWLRFFTNRFMSWLISKVAGQSIYDSQCGFRLISIQVLKNIEVESQNYDAESEFLIKASRAGYKISSVGIKTIYAGQESKIHKVRDTIRFFKLLARLSKEKK